MEQWNGGMMRSKELEDNVEDSPEEHEGEDECDHSFVLKDDLGYVCWICGVIQRGIETIIEYQYAKSFVHAAGIAAGYCADQLEMCFAGCSTCSLLFSLHLFSVNGCLIVSLAIRTVNCQVHDPGKFQLLSNLSSAVYSRLVSKATIFGIYIAVCNLFLLYFCALFMQLLLIEWCKDVSRFYDPKASKSGFCDAKASKSVVPKLANLISNDGMLSKLVFFKCS
ncbi:hypothetical protein RHMOL_Rhmol03G0066500 [Rhododendron molle]|uniref:Uncharacterized protein n=1 Tax=Rhododendron molle TaxID=49168 RepID=A0ACC0PCR7_RHOML|nr:hypothetical protein RHMOL_Rhmol03G0066500 [Rhododendron molle]